jgi:hypothetical protein
MKSIRMNSIEILWAQSYDPKAFQRKNSYGLESSKIPMIFSFNPKRGPKSPRNTPHRLKQ